MKRVVRIKTKASSVIKTTSPAWTPAWRAMIAAAGGSSELAAALGTQVMSMMRWSAKTSAPRQHTRDLIVAWCTERGLKVPVFKRA